MQENQILTTPEEEIIKIIKSLDSDDEKRDQLEIYHDYEIARALLIMDNFLRKQLYEILPLRSLAEVFEELDPEDAYDILEETSISTISKIFSEMETDDLVDIIDVIDDYEDRITYLSLIAVEKRITIKTLLNFDDSAVGSIMNNSYIELHKDMNIKEAIKKVVNEAPECEFINNIYVTEEGILIGALSLKELINAGNDKSQTVESIMSQNLIYVNPATENEDAIELMKNYDFQLLPVVDKQGKLIGIVSFDDMLEALNFESDSDYSSLAGLTETAFDTEDESVFRTVKTRMPWLIILLFVNILTSSIISSYQSVLIALPMLAVFMPLISSMAGNSGTQSLGIVIRLFATNQLDKKKSVLKHLLNQLFTGIVLGIAIAILMFVLVLIINSVRGQDLTSGLKFAGVIALSMNVALIVATIEGAFVPMIIKLIRLDPAVASGPFITTMSDIISILIYFGLASLLIHSLL